MEPNILKIRDFINKEKMYVMMLAFILLLNAGMIFTQKIPALKESFTKTKIFRIYSNKEEKIEFRYSPQDYDNKLWEQVLERKNHLRILLNIFGLAVFAVFGLGLFLDINLLLAKIKKKEIFKVSGVHLGVRWEIRDIYRLAILFIFFGYLLHLIEACFLLFLSKSERMPYFFPFLNTGIMDLAILCFVIYFVKVKYGHDLKVLGLRFINVSRFIFLAVFYYIAFLPILACILLLLILFFSLFDYQPPQQTLFNLFFQENNLWFLIYSTMLVAILGPIVEEIFFRGFAYNAIKKRWGTQKAMLLTAVVFAGLHANAAGFLPILALGFLLVYVYEKTASLIPAITIHILHNSLMITLLFLGRYLAKSLNGL
jgi:hypothetical protein